MEFKNIVATVYLKGGQAVKSILDPTPAGDVYRLCRLYNDSGIDKIIIFDLSDTDDEHEKHIHIIENINRNIEVKVCAGGNINRIDDIKKLLYAGCVQVILNASKPASLKLAYEASEIFGSEKILLSVNNVDFIFKNKKTIEDSFHELLVLDRNIVDALENLTSTQYVVYMPSYDYNEIIDLLKRSTVRGIAGDFINDPNIDIMNLKSTLSAGGIKMDNFDPHLKWSDFKLNSDGMVPVIVQDYKTLDVLMLAYMNEEAFNSTINSGRMTYWSRSRNELWVKGLTSGHFQYVKSLSADCDYDTILAKVSQVGAACHTGSRSCFFNNIVKKEYVEKNPLLVFENTYQEILADRGKTKAGSYTNSLIDKGIDEILKKLCAECTEIILAAKSQDAEDVTFEITDYIYHLMILMAEQGITWKDIAKELSQR